MSRLHSVRPLGHWLIHLAWAPVPVLLTAMLVLGFMGPRAPYESQLLLMVLNFLFSTVASLLVAILIGRSFLVRGSPGLLLLGCGVVLWGAAGTISPALLGHGPNTAVTVHNALVWLSSLCNLTGVLLSLRQWRAPRFAGLILAMAYTGAACAAWLVTLMTVEGWMPVFFVQGQGGTAVRQFVLSSAMAMFAFTSAILWKGNRPSLSTFVRFYGLALLLVATGLLGVMAQSVLGGLLGWTGRAAQFLGGVYMLVAAIASVRESRAWRLPIEDALREQTLRYELVVAGAHAAIWDWDVLDRRIAFSPQWKALRGYVEDEVSDREEEWSGGIHPEDAPRVMAAVQEHFDGTTPFFAEEYRVRRKDGSWMWVADRGLAHRDASGRVVRMAGSEADITERKQTEEALQQSRRTFVELIERAPFGIYVVDAGFRIAQMNAGSQDGAFRNVRPVIGRDFAEAMRILWPEEVALQIIGVFRHTLETGEPYYSPRFINPRADVGITESYEWELHRMTLPDGQYGVICYYYDSTKLREAEAAVRESEERLRSLAENVPCVLMRFDRQFRIDYLSPQSERYNAIPVEQFMGRTNREVGMPEELCDLWDAVIERVFSTGTQEQIEFDFAGPSGMRTFALKFAPEFSPDHEVRYVLGVSSDITERKRMEEEVRKSHTELELRVRERTAELHLTNRALREYAGKLERLNAELNEFAWVASHDLQEPLRKIQTFGDRLSRLKESLDEPGWDDLNRVIKSARRMSSLVCSLSSYAGMTREIVTVQPVDLKGTAKEAVSDLEAALCESGGTVEIGELPTIEADAEKVCLLFKNLISNAIKYSREQEKPHIRVSGEIVDGVCRIKVEDNGIGFEEQYLDRIFKPFQRLHGKTGRFEGTGMGLTICRKVVDLHGGSITAKSKPGEGSTFIVSLPVEQGARHSD